MRARTIREGSVGLLVLVGIGLFGILILWLRGINPRQRSYQLTVQFDNTSNMQIGTPVRYRGVPVGRVVSIDPNPNAVEVEVEISQGDLRIPAESEIKTAQSGLIGELSIDIFSETLLPETALSMTPVGRDCNSDIILCDGDNLRGIQGVSYEDLLESSKRIADFLADPAVAEDVSKILDNTTEVSDNVIDLTRELTVLVEDTRKQLSPLAASARQATGATARAAQQLELSAAQTSANLDTTLTEINQLLVNNRGDIVATLANVRAGSEQLRAIADTLAPTIQEGELVSNLELLSANAALASEDLKVITNSLNTDENIILLQQTLESARDVFQSAQKIMADVDELTGDPAVRSNIRDLINGLSGLVSTTQQLETQAELARMLDSVHTQASALPQIAEPLVSQPVSPSARQPAAPGQTPVLVFDGQRYTVRMADGSRPESIVPDLSE
ncbi:MAG: MlaD family protein [Cyanobacteria bacterium P01_A01_bin.114]